MTASSFLRKMSVEVLTVHKECPHENDSLNHLLKPYFTVLGPVAHLASCPGAGKRDPTGVRQSNRTRKVGSQAHPNLCTCAPIGGESGSVFSDTFSINISHGSYTSANFRTHTVSTGNTDC